MARFICGSCGHQVETRCKPKTCPNCGNKDNIKKE